MKKTYLSNLSRLSIYFESSRDKWRARSHRNQSDKRVLQTRVRDASRSAAKWKQKYEALQAQVISQSQALEKKK